MYLSDYHTHCALSFDSETPVEEMVRAGIAAGLQELCLTDHVDLYPSGGTEHWEHDFSGREETFARAERAAEGRLVIRRGIELGEAARDVQYADALLAQLPELDFVIGSQHQLSERYGNTDLYFMPGGTEAEARAQIADYLTLVLETAKWGKFSVLGHLTLPLRYMNENHGMHMSFDGFEDEVTQILRTVIEDGRGIECNVNRGNTPLPDGKWLKLYRALGGEIITVGTDAHTPEFVGRHVRETQELLRACVRLFLCVHIRAEKTDFSQNLTDKRRNTMKIALGCDHGGYAMKEDIKKQLIGMGHEVKDCGTYSTDSCDYPVFGEAAARAVASGECEYGIVICTTGIGISIAANKVKGIRCAHCADALEAQLCRQHNNANMLAIGAGFTGPKLAAAMVETFLSTGFEGGRHARRVALLDGIEG